MLAADKSAVAAQVWTLPDDWLSTVPVIDAGETGIYPMGNFSETEQMSKDEQIACETIQRYIDESKGKDHEMKMAYNNWIFGMELLAANLGYVTAEKLAEAHRKQTRC